MSESSAPSVDAQTDPFQVCADIAQSHYENFPIGSFLFPRRLRPHLWAIYAFCRTVDDLGDEAAGDRLAHLDRFERELDACFGGTPTLPAMQALQQTIAQCSLPPIPFYRLIEANRQDQRVTRYETFDALLDYCRLSANPVGHLVLALLGIQGKSANSFADATCTALQLTNFWQDVAEDWAKGRVYIPEEVMRTHGYTMDMLAGQTVNSAWHAMMKHLVDRTRTYFQAGDALLPRIPRRFKMDIALFSLGGRRILDGIEAVRFDVFRRRPRLTSGDKTRLFWQAFWRYGPLRRTM